MRRDLPVSRGYGFAFWFIITGRREGGILLSGSSFLKGAIILAVGSLISRGLGAVYRFLLPWVMGGGSQAMVGMGLFNYAYPLYIALLGISATGIPSAVAKLVAENQVRGDYEGIRSIFRFSLWILSIVGLALSLVLYLVAPYYAATVVKDPRATLSIQAIAPAIFLVSVMSAFRGYFQGLQNMVPHAVSQVIEQVARIAPMFLLAWLLLPYGIEYSAAGATFGAVTGALGGLVYLAYVYLRSPILTAFSSNVADVKRDNKRRDAFSTFREIMSLAVPISLVGVILPLMGMIDSVVVPARLHAAGFKTDDATGLYGILTGIAMPFVMAPTLFTAALATSLVPSVAEASAGGDTNMVRRRAEAGTRITILICMPAAAGLLSLAREIPVMFYGIPEAGMPLALLSMGALFLGLQQTSSAILQGMGYPAIPMKTLLAGSVAKLVITWGLTGIAGVNINGAALATTLAFLVAAWLNNLAMESILGFRIRWGEIGGKPLLASVLMFFAVRLLFYFLEDTFGLKLLTLLAIAVGASVYAFALIISGGVTSRDFEMIPFLGRRAASWFQRIHLLRK